MFFLFGFLTLIAIVFFIRRVPEMKGRSLAAIAADLRRLQLPSPEERLPLGQIGHAA